LYTHVYTMHEMFAACFIMVAVAQVAISVLTTLVECGVLTRIFRPSIAADEVSDDVLALGTPPEYESSHTSEEDSA